MNLRISFFDKAVFRKNMTRFAPVWGLYTVCMFLGLFLMLDSGNFRWLASNMGQCVQLMAVITPCYALLTAQMLFGDLFSSRMCNALHALPLRRETWFMTNLVSAFVFHLIPTVSMGLVAVMIIAFTGYDVWMMGFGWLLGVNLQYVCFFSIAVLCAMLTGNRFAMAVLYAIVNFASLILGWMIDTLYIPMLYGIQLLEDAFLPFCPVGQMITDGFIEVERNYRGVDGPDFYGRVTPGEGFGYYFICAGIGIVLLAFAMELYRRRRLECAGDFMAFRILEPVFHMAYSLMMGAVFAYVVDDFLGMGSGYGMAVLFAGLAVGYFTGKMLLERSTRVFGLKTWFGCGGLVIGFALSLLLVALDPFGVVERIPQPEQVTSVSIWDSRSQWYESKVTLTDPADIEKVNALHSFALEERLKDMNHAPTVEYAEAAGEMEFSQNITIHYELKNGKSLIRNYYVWMGGEDGENLKMWFSSFSGVFRGAENPEALMDMCQTWHLVDALTGTEHYLPDEEAALSLFAAIEKDCQAGTMVQSYNYHRGQGSKVPYWLYLEIGEQVMERRLYADCTHTMQWLRDHGYEVDEILLKLEY